MIELQLELQLEPFDPAIWVRLIQIDFVSVTITIFIRRDDDQKFGKLFLENWVSSYYHRELKKFSLETFLEKVFSSENAFQSSWSKFMF